MPTIADLVSILRRREGVDAAVILGRDGLLIDGAGGGHLDPEGLAALVPPLAIAAGDLGRAAGRSDPGLMVLDCAEGAVVVCPLSSEAILLVVLRADANLAALLFELRRHRAQIAALV